MHLGGDASLRDLQSSARRWDGAQAYSDTKLQDVLLAFGVARRWPWQAAWEGLHAAIHRPATAAA